ncbi:hypothetical protein DFJ73DRAFT_773561 [Zopfochytrium polystomum]|nr:hypothetical protein DFJ73DRAFT_773561 [Zopfochytrium polystomum]
MDGRHHRPFGDDDTFQRGGVGVVVGTPPSNITPARPTSTTTTTTMMIMVPPPPARLAAHPPPPIAAAAASAASSIHSLTSSHPSFNGGGSTTATIVGSTRCGNAFPSSHPQQLSQEETIHISQQQMRQEKRLFREQQAHLQQQQQHQQYLLLLQERQQLQYQQQFPHAQTQQPTTPISFFARQDTQQHQPRAYPTPDPDVSDDHRWNPNDEMDEDYDSNPSSSELGTQQYYYNPSNPPSTNANITASAPPTVSGATTFSSGDRGWDPSAVMSRLGSKQLDFTTHETPTLYTLLQKHVPDKESVNEEFKNFQVIVSWLLGAPEAALGHFARRSRSRDSRRSAAAAATEAEVLKLVTAAARIPSKVNPELKMAALDALGEDGYQTAACIAAFIGWTNGMGDTTGMELGVNDYLFAKRELEAAGWSGARHAPAGMQDAGPGFDIGVATSSSSVMSTSLTSSSSSIHGSTMQPALSASHVVQAVSEEVTPRKGLSRLADYRNVLSHVSASGAESDPWAAQIPSTHKKIDEWLKEKMGFLPSYVEVIKNVEAKRAVCLMMWVFLVRNNGTRGGGAGDPCVEGEACEWTAGAKALLFYVYATKTGNLLLRGHAAFLAIKNHVPISVLLSTASSIPTHDPRLDAALDLIRAAASLRRSFPATLNKRLVDTANSPKGVMELVSAIGVFNMLHRLSAVLAPEPVKFEKEVREFLAMFAPVLGMDPADASPQSSEERMVVDPLQFLYAD